MYDEAFSTYDGGFRKHDWDGDFGIFGNGRLRRHEGVFNSRLEDLFFGAEFKSAEEIEHISKMIGQDGALGPIKDGLEENSAKHIIDEDDLATSQDGHRHELRGWSRAPITREMADQGSSTARE